MRTLWLTIVFLVLAATGANAVDKSTWPYKPDWVFFALDCKLSDKLCVVRDNRGGIIVAYDWAAEQLLDRNLKVRIAGKCYSSCVRLASLARKNVCITKSAKMGIHQELDVDIWDPHGTWIDPNTKSGAEMYDDPPVGFYLEARAVDLDLGDDINKWVQENGKMVPPDKMYELTYAEARQFWVACR